MRIVSLPFLAFLLLTTVLPARAEDADPPEVAIGERLFLETRFAQFFFVNAANVNQDLAKGDPVVATTQTFSQSLAGPFAGQSMNCRACHMVDEFRNNPDGGVRTYSDFARRSPIPERGDGRHFTPRNSPTLVNSGLASKNVSLFHFDGVFSSLPELVKGTLTGRNYGWLASEQKAAIKHIARVIRQDNGSGELAKQFGGPYRRVFAGKSEDFELPDIYRINVDSATDAKILDKVALLIAVYVQQLSFQTDANGNFNGSPYDLFLRFNNLPLKPVGTETNLDYARRLRSDLQKLTAPVYVTPANGKFQFHNHAFAFGQQELDGLKIFLAEPAAPQASASELTAGKIGNCLACHAPPTFSDLRFHNTGASQDEYDAIHGAGAFSNLHIPTLAERKSNPDFFLPPHAKKPNAKGIFAAAPDVANPQLVDLGLWNVFQNPDVKLANKALARMMKAANAPKDLEAQLQLTIAAFKTPTLRDLGQSGPYLHTGQKDTLSSVLQFYIDLANLNRTGKVRNPDPEIARIALTNDDIANLAAFLKSLDEDYE